MDVTEQLAEFTAQTSTSVLARSTPVEVDPGLLAAFDNSPVDPVEYSSNLNPHLLSLTLTSTHSLISHILTNHPPMHGTFRLPAPTTLLPREKPLPKPKQPTKWERFAKEKGISHSKKERKIWDDEKQDWVNRWGRDGKNKEAEEQWIHEVKPGSEADQDPAMTARKERKARMAKNEKQHLANLAKASSSSASSSAAAPLPISSLSRPATATAQSDQKTKKSARDQRKAELDRAMLVSKSSTASLGKFDKQIEGEPKAKGVKRKFDAQFETDGAGEKERLLGVLKGVESGVRRKKGEESVVNKRKAVRGVERSGALKGEERSRVMGKKSKGKGRK